MIESAVLMLYYHLVFVLWEKELVKINSKMVRTYAPASKTN